MGWLVIVGVGFWVVLAVCSVLYLRKPEANNGCPGCRHEIGLDERGKHCNGQDDNNGWSSDICQCENDYHWRYEWASHQMRSYNPARGTNE